MHVCATLTFVIGAHPRSLSCLSGRALPTNKTMPQEDINFLKCFKAKRINMVMGTKNIQLENPTSDDAFFTEAVVQTDQVLKPPIPDSSVI